MSLPTLYRFGLDWVTVNLRSGQEYPALEIYFEGLSANSNEKKQVQFFGHEFDVVMFEGKLGQVVMFSYYGDSVFELTKVRDVGLIRSLAYRFSFYSTYFYIDDIQDVMMLFLGKYQEQCQMSRVDIAMDVSCTVKDLYEKHRTRTRKSIVRRDGEEIETFYVGAKVGNKKHFVRVYDKKLDSRKKGKFHLFLPYFEEETVTRVEVQLNVESLRNFAVTVSTLFNPGALWSIFDACCRNDEGTIFPQLVGLRPVDCRSLLRAGARTMEMLDQLGYARTMLGYARRLHNLGFDVLGYLSCRLADETQKKEEKDYYTIKTTSCAALRAIYFCFRS